MEITRLPLDAIKVTDQQSSGYLLYDRVAGRIIVAAEQDTAHAIRRSGDVLTGPIYYDSSVPMSMPQQLIDFQYVEDATDTLLAQWSNYLPVTGGTMTGPILLATTSTHPDAVVSKGQVDAVLDPNQYIPLSGGSVSEVFALHSDVATDYTDMCAVPMFVVSEAVNSAIQSFRDAWAAQYLHVDGGVMVGPLYSETECPPNNDRHAVTKGFVKEYVQNYVTGTDWSCSDVAGSAVGCTVTSDTITSTGCGSV